MFPWKIARSRTKRLVTACAFICLWIMLTFTTNDISKKTSSQHSRSNVSALATESTTAHATTYVLKPPKLFHQDEFDTKISCSINHTCSSWFENSFAENLKIISAYPMRQNPHFPTLGTPKNTLTLFPYIVTSASAGFYYSSQGLLKSVYEKLVPKYGHVKVLYYDMGLDRDQLKQLQNHCDICIIRKFDFQKYPTHVASMRTYAWKPLIIKDALRDYNWVWWMDSSARITSGDLDQALEYSRKHSILHFTYGPSLSIARHTDARTMQYLGEDVCKFRHFGEIEAGFVLYYFDDVTKTVVDVWGACALDRNCIAPPRAKKSCNPRVNTDGKCHRFDQSVLSIILRRLFHKCNDSPIIEHPMGIHEIRRGERVSFFPRK